MSKTGYPPRSYSITNYSMTLEICLSFNPKQSPNSNRKWFPKCRTHTKTHRAMCSNRILVLSRSLILYSRRLMRFLIQGNRDFRNQDFLSLDMINRDFLSLGMVTNLLSNNQDSLRWKQQAYQECPRNNHNDHNQRSLSNNPNNSLNLSNQRWWTDFNR